MSEQQEQGQHWDLETVLDERITPLMAQITDICKEHQLPFLACFQYARNTGEDGEANFCTTRVHREGEHKSLEAAFQIVRQGFFAYTATRRQ